MSTKPVTPVPAKKETAPPTPAVAKPKVDKKEKLKELASARVSKAVKYIRACHRLTAYEPTQEQLEKIVVAFVNEVNTLKGVYAAHVQGGSKKKSESSFTL